MDSQVCRVQLAPSYKNCKITRMRENTPPGPNGNTPANQIEKPSSVSFNQDETSDGTA